MIADDVELEPIDEAAAPRREPTGTDGEPRRKRRRRRRGGRGTRERTPAEKSGAESTDHPDDADHMDHLDVDEEQITRERIRAEGGMLDDEDDADDDHPDLGDDGHHTHRGIPTWDEAVGMIISVNLESRQKNPHVSSGHYRGGRGRGRGRGGERGGDRGGDRNRGGDRS